MKGVQLLQILHILPEREIARTFRHFRIVQIKWCRCSVLELMVKGNPQTPEASKPFEATAAFAALPKTYQR